MTDPSPAQPHGSLVGRRTLMKAAAAGVGAVALAPIAALAQEDRDYGPDAPPVHYPDPDVVSVTPAFDQYRVGNSAIQRLWTGGLWLEGPAWNGVGRFLLWSDIPNNIQLRRLEDDGQVSVFRNPSGNSNGNTFDWEGRQISCQHGNRQVVRYEHDGSTTVLAGEFEGKPFNSPNDAVVHPNGSIFFTDPPYGTLPVGGYEATPASLSCPTPSTASTRMGRSPASPTSSRRPRQRIFIPRACPTGHQQLLKKSLGACDRAWKEPLRAACGSYANEA
jgi:gluconolactonase